MRYVIIYDWNVARTIRLTCFQQTDKTAPTITLSCSTGCCWSTRQQRRTGLDWRASEFLLFSLCDIWWWWWWCSGCILVKTLKLDTSATGSVLNEWNHICLCQTQTNAFVCQGEPGIDGEAGPSGPDGAKASMKVHTEICMNCFWLCSCE